MRILKKWLIFLFLVATVHAAESFFVSSEEIVQIEKPQTVVHKSFIYRIKAQTKIQYYQIGMNKLLFGTFNGFLWPKNIPAPERYAMPIFVKGSDFEELHEIVFNNGFLFSDQENLYFKNNGNFEKLIKADDASVILFSSRDSVNVFREIDERVVSRELPFFLNKVSNGRELFLFDAPEKQPEVKIVDVKKKTYDEMKINLSDFPDFSLVDRQYELNPPNVYTDEDKLFYVDSILEVIQDDLHKDTLQLRVFSDSINALYKPKNKILLEENALLLASVLSKNLTSNYENIWRKKKYASRIDLFQERAKFLLTLRDNLKEVIKKSKEPDVISFDKFSEIRLSGAVGRIVPEWVSNPGPSKLWAASVGLQHTQKISSHTYLSGGIQYLYSQWNFNQAVKAVSSQQYISFSLPFGVAFPLSYSRESGNSFFSFYCGPMAAYAITSVENLKKMEKNEVVFGIRSGAVVHLSQMGMRIFVEFANDNMQYGDLSLGVGFSLPFLKWNKGG